MKKFIVVEEEEKGERAIDERRWSFVRSVEKRRTRPATVYNTWNNNWFRCGARKCSEHRGAARRGFLSRNRLHGQRRSEKTAGMRREIFETVQPRCSSSLPNAQTDCPFRLLFTVAKRIANARTRTFLRAVSFSPLSLLYYYVYVFLFSFPLFSPSFPFLLFFPVFYSIHHIAILRNEEVGMFRWNEEMRAERIKITINPEQGHRYAVHFVTSFVRAPPRFLLLQNGLPRHDECQVHRPCRKMKIRLSFARRKSGTRRKGNWTRAWEHRDFVRSYARSFVRSRAFRFEDKCPFLCAALTARRRVGSRWKNGNWA